jgi:hypothetical protein
LRLVNRIYKEMVHMENSRSRKRIDYTYVAIKVWGRLKGPQNIALA